MESRLQKLCCVCGVDLWRQRRTKDPRGRYFCKPCWHSLLAEYYQRNGGPPTISAVTPADPQPEVERSEESAPPAALDTPAGSTAAADAPAPAILCMLPIAVAIPPALYFSPDARLQRVGLIASAAIAAVMVLALVHAALHRPCTGWSIRLIRHAGRWVRDLLQYGGSLSVAIAAALGLLWLAWSRAGSTGAAIISLGLLIAASQALARRVRPAAVQVQSNMPESADISSPAPEVAAVSGATTDDSEATFLPLHADPQTRAAEVRPRCRPVFAPGRDAWVRRREAGFRMSDLLTAVAYQSLDNDEPRGDGDSSDSSALGATLEPPLRLAVEARRVGGGPAMPADPSSDSSVTGFSAAKMQSWDANRRAWA